MTGAVRHSIAVNLNMTANDIHFQALCNAIENEKLDKCHSILLATTGPNPNPILSSRGIDLTIPNNDGFTPLDLAFMTGNSDLMDLVLDHGAKEGTTFPTPDAASVHLHGLIHESKKQIEKFGQLIKAAHNPKHASGHPHSHQGLANVPPQLSQSQLKECEKQQTLWQKRMATLKRLKQGFDNSGCPHAPSEVIVEVTNTDTIGVKLEKPVSVNSKSLYTKCKIQWSSSDTFDRLDGQLIVTEVTKSSLDFKIENLTEGQRYFIRASFGNPKGFGPFCASTPKSLVPSSWRSVEDKAVRIRDQLAVCTEVYAQMNEQLEEDYDHHKFSHKRKGFLHLFSSSSTSTKFQRHLQPNKLYLALILFHEDKVLMTNDEILPIVEVSDEISSINITSDFNWLAKLTFVFKDVEKLRHEMTKINGSSCSTRSKLLQAVLNLQHSLGITDIGTTYHRPFKNDDGTVIFSLINHVKNPKALVNINLKWVPLSKAQRRSSFDQNINPVDILRYSLREQILFQQVCQIKLSKGLYLCYVQAESSIDSMSVIVSNTSPTILPYIKVRENNHVTKDEWAWVIQMGHAMSQSSSMQAPSPTTNFLAGEGEEGSEILSEEIMKQLRPTENQYLFGKRLLLASQRLFDYLEIKQENRASHVIFDSELLEVSPEVSVIFILPPSDQICSVADIKPLVDLKRNDLLGINLNLFETIHMSAYHRQLIESFYKTILHLEIHLTVAKQTQREAFNNDEVEKSQQTVNSLIELQKTLEETWKPVRWLLDILSQGRNKTSSCGLSYQYLIEWYQFQTSPPDDSHLCLESSSKNPDDRRLFKHGTMSRVSSALPSQASAGSTNLSRTPTTRSDPLEFNLSHNNKENEVWNFPRIPHQPPLLSTSPGNSSNFQPTSHKKTSSSSYSSLTYSSQQSTNSSSLSSNPDPQSSVPVQEVSGGHEQPKPVDQPVQYQNVNDNSARKFDPLVAQSGMFLSDANLSAASRSRRFQRSPEPNVLQVFAAYDSGLASGTSVKLNVNHDTTTREVIDLVIKQLNMAVILKGKEGPIYENDKLKNFCLVAVIGNRERCLRDDFKPLNLQNPWKSGKLFVRMKNDLLAAIDHISRHSTML